MTLTFEVTLPSDNHELIKQDVCADRFEIEEGGVLVFYEDKNADNEVTLAGLKNEQPITAFKEWASVEEV